MKTLDEFILSLLKFTPSIKEKDRDFSWQYKDFDIKVANWGRSYYLLINNKKQINSNGRNDIKKETYDKIETYTKNVWVKLESKIKNEIRSKKLDNIL